ncbi:helix-turn-helix transcriptional regulator, partial [Janibacter melonis]|uniref:helix-turn-helix transcriptional regulator n=1 Tax=Janibacter melonis TaxID=262209 RepID=UPI001CEF9567
TRAARFHPLLSSIEPDARVGPAVLKLLIIDRGTVVVEGPGTASGDSTAWVITDRSLLAEAAALWPVLWKASRPLLAPGQKPPLGQRQLEVARLMCLGHTDASIARAMNLSARSVARDIARIMTLTSSRSRPEAVLAILGRGRHART